MKKSKIILLFSILLLIGLFVIRFKAESNYILKTENHTSGVVTECLKNSKMIIKGKSKLLVEYESFACEPGINVNVHGYFTLPENSKVFYLFNYRKYLLSKNIKYLFKATKVEKASDKIILKYQIKNIIYKYLEGYKSKDYMYAFLLADSKDIDKSYIENYRRTGIIHLFSISGVHIAIMTSILLTALGKIFKDKDTSFFITFVFLIFYLFLTNFSPPIVRATILFISLNIGKIFNIKVKSLYITLFSFLILLVANPFYIYSVGFILSYVISIFIILSNKIIKRIKHNLTKNVVLQVICFLASYPITVNSNFEIHLLSLFASLVFTPLICFIIYPLCLTSLIFRPFDYAVYHMMDLINSLTSRLDSIDLFNIPFSHINIFFIIVYYAILLLCILKPQNFLIIILFIIIHYNINYINFIPLITTIDIGQGDSILVKIEKINILIDTGGDPFFKDRKISQNIIIPYLKAEGIHKLDYLILSHGGLVLRTRTIERKRANY